MSTATVTVPRKVEDAFTKMQGRVSRYARSNDRRMVLRTLREVPYLSCIALDPLARQDEFGTSIVKLETEASKEHIVLNGVPFYGSKHFLTTLRDLCESLVQGLANISADQLYLSLIVRMSRSTSSADSYFKLNNLLGSPDLLLMPVKTNQQSYHNRPQPIYINLYASNGCVQGTVSCTNSYGLFRKADVKPSDLVKGSMSGRPWISIQAQMDERINFSTNLGIRNLCVKLPDSLY